MRLDSNQAQLIVQGVKRHLGPRATVWLFGSRLDDAKKGGDVDLLVRRFQEDSPIARIAKGQGQRLE